MSLKRLKEYPGILKRVHEGQRFLDMGCCFGQAIRQLAADGVPSENLYGCDIREEYITLGYKLFCDQQTLNANFITSDILDAASPINHLKGHFDIIYTQSFFHLWGYDDQIKVSKAVAALLRPQAGSLITGRQVGTASVAKDDPVVPVKGTMFLHNVQSFKKMWKEIGEDIGATFTVDAHMDAIEAEFQSFHSSDISRISFTVRRE